MRTTPASTRRQRGAAALLVTLLLLFAMALVAMFANRNLVFEQRTSANQYRSTQAFEAAEAGLEWALAQLNANRRIGADCQPSTDPAADSFRGHYLRTASNTGELTPQPWIAAGVPTALLLACVYANGRWSCSCPSNGPANLTAPVGPAPAPAFSLQFFATGKPGVVRVVANGCTQLAGACLAGSTGRPDASARIEVTFGLVGGLRTPPAATVTTRGAFEAGRAAIGLHNADPGTGIAANAGGAIDATAARLTPPAGAPVDGLLVGNDASLAALDADRFFAAHFGVDKAAWKAQPAVTRIRCNRDCASVLGIALAAAPDAALIHVEGDLTLAGPVTIGSAARPVAIVVDGHAQLDGAVALHGLLYAASLHWGPTSGGAVVRGALLSEGAYRGSGAPDLVYDPGVLGQLVHTSGSFARVSGSWRDF